jgi:DNA-binding transcriptional LysR family regulator
MNSEHLNYFISLSETLNFSETARQMGVPQPTISRSILELEHQLNAQLFLRNKRSVTLTREGETFLPYARDVVSTLDRGAFAVERIRQGASGIVSVAALTTTVSVVTQCIAAFSKRYPNITVDVQYNTGSSQLDCLSQRKYDFYFSQEESIPRDQGFDSIVTHQDTLVLAVPEDHSITTENYQPYLLASERLIMLSKEENPAIYAAIERLFVSAHLVPHVVQRYNKAESILLSVAAGMGIAFIPKNLALTMNSKGTRLVELPNPPTGNYVVAWHKESANPAARLFLETMKECLGKDKPEDIHSDPQVIPTANAS